MSTRNSVTPEEDDRPPVRVDGYTVRRGDDGDPTAFVVKVSMLDGARYREYSIEFRARGDAARLRNVFTPNKDNAPIVNESVLQAVGVASAFLDDQGFAVVDPMDTVDDGVGKYEQYVQDDDT